MTSDLKGYMTDYLAAGKFLLILLKDLRFRNTLLLNLVAEVFRGRLLYFIKLIENPPPFQTYIPKPLGNIKWKK